VYTTIKLQNFICKYYNKELFKYLTKSRENIKEGHSEWKIRFLRERLTFQIPRKIYSLQNGYYVRQNIPSHFEWNANYIHSRSMYMYVLNVNVFNILILT